MSPPKQKTNQGSGEPSGYPTRLTRDTSRGRTTSPLRHRTNSPYPRPSAPETNGERAEQIRNRKRTHRIWGYRHCINCGDYPICDNGSHHCQSVSSVSHPTRARSRSPITPAYCATCGLRVERLGRNWDMHECHHVDGDAETVSQGLIWSLRFCTACGERNPKKWERKTRHECKVLDGELEHGVARFCGECGEEEPAKGIYVIM